MTAGRAEIGICFDRSFPAGAMPDYARHAEAAGIEQLWVIEDCFFTAGISLAATALAVTDDLTVGMGILPAVARAVPITAMEIATLCGLAPGRVVAGIGHGVQEWMAQMGVRPSSPLGALEETIECVKRLLAGEEVSFDGQAVQLDRVRLEQPPSMAPPVVAGVQQERSMALAGRVADGVILVEGVGPTYVERSLRHAARRPDSFSVITFTLLSIADDRRDAYAPIVSFVAGLVRDHRPALTVLPFFDEMHARVASSGDEALLDMPADYWREIGAIGTLDDAHSHIDALEAAGVSSINIFPGPDLDIALGQMSDIADLVRR